MTISSRGQIREVKLKKRDWFIVIIPLFCTWAVDHLTKVWANSISGYHFWGPIGLTVRHNQGAMLGLFSDLPAVLRIVSLSTGGAFLLFVFMLVQYLLPIKSLTLRVGLSILIGGILGNVTDRILYGYVIDFITIGSAQSSSPIFNLADALQWVGYVMIAWALMKEGNVLWPESDNRHTRWVNVRFQLRYCFVLMAMGFGLAAIAGVYSYTFLRVTILDLVGPNPRLLSHYLLPFVLTFVVVCFAFGALLFLAGRAISQRMAGPLYAFEKYLDDLMDGKPRPLRLRSGDEFKHLEQLAARLTEEWQKRSAEIESLIKAEEPQ
jgi:signal peptidase II